MKTGISSVFDPTQYNRVMANPGSGLGPGPSHASSVPRRQARPAHTSQPPAARDRTTWPPDVVNARLRSWFANIQEHGEDDQGPEISCRAAKHGHKHTVVCTHTRHKRKIKVKLKSKDASPTHHNLSPKKEGKRKEKVGAHSAFGAKYIVPRPEPSAEGGAGNVSIDAEKLSASVSLLARSVTPNAKIVSTHSWRWGSFDVGGKWSSTYRVPGEQLKLLLGPFQRTKNTCKERRDVETRIPRGVSVD
ncbi:hypothetical protein LY76DRAFT_679185, partial [Colletotrichum caudatum]